MKRCLPPIIVRCPSVVVIERESGAAAGTDDCFESFPRVERMGLIINLAVVFTVCVWQWRDFFKELEESCSLTFVRKKVRVRWDEVEGAFRHSKFSDAIP